MSPRESGRENGGDGMSANTCVYCGADLNQNAFVCKACGNARCPLWIAKARTSWVGALLRLMLLGALGWGVSQAYQAEAVRSAEISARARHTADSSLAIQTLADELRRPCWSRSDTECATRFDRILSDLDTNTYSFKESARALVVPGPSIKNAIDFVDNFYNPDTGIPLGMNVLPLQPALLRSAPLLSKPFDARKWCSLEGRATIRDVTASIDVYRYCYGRVRKYVSDYADHVLAVRYRAIAWLQPFQPKVTDAELEECDASGKREECLLCRSETMGESRNGRRRTLGALAI